MKLLKHIYYRRKSANIVSRREAKFKRTLKKHGLLPHGLRFRASHERMHASLSTKKRRLSALKQNLITQNEGLNAVNDIQFKFVKSVIKKNPSVQELIVGHYWPVFARRLQDKISNVANDPRRQKLIAFTALDCNLSHRKRQKNRVAVCLCAFCCFSYCFCCFLYCFCCLFCMCVCVVVVYVDDQRGMVKRVRYDALGRPTHCRATPIYFTGKIHCLQDNSYAVNKKCYEEWYQLCDDNMPWYKNGEFLQCKFKYLMDAILFGMTVHVDSDMCEKWNTHYHSYAIEPNVNTFAVTDVIRARYALPTASSEVKSPSLLVPYSSIRELQRCYFVPRTLTISTHTDAIDAPRAPTDIDTGCHSHLHLHVFNEKGLIHTGYCKIGFISSGISEHNPLYFKLFHILVSMIPQEGFFAVFSTKKKTWMLFHYTLKNNADWQGTSGVLHGCVNHNGEYAIPYVSKIIGKNAVTISMKNQVELKKALVAGIKDEHMPWNLPSLAEMDDNANFYTLTTREIWKYYQNQTENGIAEAKSKYRAKLMKSMKDKLYNMMLEQHNNINNNNNNNNGNGSDIEDGNGNNDENESFVYDSDDIDQQIKEDEEKLMEKQFDEKWTHEYEKKKRIEIARKNMHGVLYQTPHALIDYVFEVLHFNLRINVTTVAALAIYLWTKCEWTIAEITDVLSASRMYIYMYFVCI